MGKLSRPYCPDLAAGEGRTKWQELEDEKRLAGEFLNIQMQIAGYRDPVKEKVKGAIAKREKKPKQ